MMPLCRPRRDAGPWHHRRLARQRRSCRRDRAGGGHARRDLTVPRGGKTTEMVAEQFFLGPMVTALPPTGFLIAARFPVWPEPRIGVGFHEINARQSDFAFVSAAAQIAVDAAGRLHARCCGHWCGHGRPAASRCGRKALEGRHSTKRPPDVAEGCACRHRADGRLARIRQLSPSRCAPRSLSRAVAEPTKSARCRCALNSTSTGRSTRSRSSRA